jgi:hypothetical protein
MGDEDHSSALSLLFAPSSRSHSGGLLEDIAQSLTDRLILRYVCHWFIILKLSKHIPCSPSNSINSQGIILFQNVPLFVGTSIFIIMFIGSFQWSLS